MLVLNPDLINSCRVCRSPNQDGDYERLYQISSEHGESPVLSEAGILYEDLLNISLNTWYNYPQFLCNSCDLQIKLFKKLKDKAHKTFEYLQNLYGEEIGKATDVIQQVLLDEQEAVANHTHVAEECVDEYHENEFEECQDGISEYQGNIANEFEEYATGEHQDETPNENLGNAIKEHHEYTVNTYREISENEYGENLYEREEEKLTTIGTSKKELLSNVTEIAPFEVINKTSLNLSANISQLSLKLEPLIDKNDYVTEIYELLDDEDKIETCSENNEDIIEFDLYTDDKIEPSSAFSDIEYADKEEIYSPDENHQEIGKNRCSNVSKNVKATRKREYKCKPCQLEFNNLQDHRLHKTQVHHERYTCNKCSKELKSAAALHNHMKLHNPQSAYQCEICQKTFNQKAHYQYHMNHHNNVRNFKCNVCQKAFISKTDLKVHMRCHSGQRPYICNICGKDYLMMEHLKTHLLSHTDQYFQCEICNHKFATHKTLRLHERTIHEDEPKFKCSFCLKPFRRKHHLEYHMKLHQENVIYLDEVVDDPTVDETEYNVDFLDEEDSVEDPGFIALNDDVIQNDDEKKFNIFISTKHS